MAVISMALALGLTIRLLWRGGMTTRATLLAAATLWTATLVLITEILTPLHGLTQPALSTVWLLVSACLWWFGRRWKARKFRVNINERWLCAAVVLILLAVLVTACVSPPNTLDALVYHMPRVIIWAQQAGVNNYPTDNFPQLQQPPGAEYIFLHLFVLSGTDRLVNCVSWAALALSALAASQLAFLLGAASFGQWLAALLIVTIPGAILEGSGPKNDVIAGCWLLIAMVFLLLWAERPTWQTLLTAGLAFGLALLTKGTIYVYGLPILAAVLWQIRKVPLRHAWIFAAAVLTLNAAFWARNMDLGGSPLGIDAPREFQPRFTNHHFGAGPTLSNLLRNVALHFTLPGGGSEKALLNTVQTLHPVLGSSLNDPATTWPGTNFQPVFSFNEAEAGDFLFALVFCAGLAGSYRSSQPILLGVAAAFLLFCALLMWQPWHARLHLPLLFAASAPLALWMDRAWRSRPAALTVAALLLAGALPYVLFNQSRPWVGERSVFTHSREAAYGNDDPSQSPEHVRLAVRASEVGCREVGLDSRVQPAQYMIMHVLRNLLPQVHFQNAAVGNISRRYRRPGQPPPCAILCPGCGVSANPAGWTGETIGFSSLFVPLPSKVDSACSARFTEGWYPPEGALRWTSRTGTLRVQSANDREVQIAAGMISPLVRGAVDVAVNGTVIKHFERSAFLSVPAHLMAGDNVIEFISLESGRVLAPDPRTLAFALRDLHILGADYGYQCSLIQAN